MKTIVIAGAGGYLGSRVAKEAQKRGYKIRLLMRRSEQGGKLGFSPDQVYVGEATRPETLEGLCTGADCVFSSLGITRQKDGLSYEEVDFQANMNILDLALREGAERFAYVSVFRGEELKRTKLVAAKERFVSALKEAPIQSTVLRPTGFFSDMEDFLRMASSGRAYLFGDGGTKFNPIDGEDLARVCLDALEAGTEELAAGGPEVFTINEIAALAFRALGKPVRILHLPDGIRRFALWLLPKITPVTVHGPVEFFLSAMALDMEAPQYGEKTLEELFRKRADKYRGKKDEPR